MTRGITTKALLARRLLKFYALRDRYLMDKYSPVKIAEIEDRIVRLQQRIAGTDYPHTVPPCGKCHGGRRCTCGKRPNP